MRHTRILAATTVVLLSLGACSSGSETAGTTTSAAQTTTSPVETTTSLVAATEPEPESTTTTAALVCEPPPDDQLVVVALPAWEAGTERSLELRTTKDSNTVVGTSLTPINLTVLEDLEEGWAFEWQYGDTSFPDTQFAPWERDQVDKLLGEIPQLRIEYGLDHDRYWTGLRNPDEIRAGLSIAVEALDDAVGDDDLDTGGSFYDSLSDEDLGFAVAEDLGIFHFFENVSLFVDDQLKYSEPFPNILGGEPFPATTTIRILDMADQDGCVVLEAVTIPDPELFGPILEDSLSIAFPDLSEDETLEFTETFLIETRVTARYDYGSTFLHEISTVQTITLGSETQIESTVLTDVTS